LTWNSSNALATGLGQGTDAGLSRLGGEAIALMNQLGVIVDLTHASPRTFWDVVGRANAPLIVSHANARALRDHERNLDADQLAAVRDLGGMVGVVAYPEFVGERPLSVEHVVDHIEHLAEVIGVDLVGIGCDFIDFNLEPIRADLLASGVYDSVDDEDLVFPEGIEDARSVRNIVASLRRREWADSDIEKVAWRNFARVMAEVERAAA
jgi:membrane dipeptidase